MAIAAAMAALGDGKPDVALRGLLAEWRKTRAPALADAVLHLGRVMDEARPAIPGRRGARVAAWKKVARAGDPADVGRLLRGLEGLGPDDAAALLDAVRAWPADPRTWDVLFGWLEAPPVGLRGRNAQPHWERVLAILESLGDPRTRDRRAAMRKTLQAGGDIDAHRHLPDTTVTLLAVLDAVPAGRAEKAKALTAKDAAALASLKPAARGDLGALWARVYETPADDGARQILADALLESGDARGELINLQLLPKPDAAQRKRAKALLDQHGRAWLGPLAPAVLKTGLAYRRGFPAAAKLSTNQSSVVTAVMGRPEWNTFEALDVEAWPADTRKAFVSQPLRGLKCATGLEHAVDLPDHAVAWEEVGFRYVGPEQMAVIQKVTTLPKLKALRLGFVFDGPFRGFWKCPIARTIEEIDGGFNLDDWARNAPKTIVRFRSYKTLAERTPKGIDVAIRCEFSTGIASTYGDGLGQARDLLHRVKVTMLKPLEPADKAAFERAVKGVPIEWVL